jgi:hypothetical protein
MNSDITEQYLNNTYDNFSREQQKLLNELKSSSDVKKSKQVEKEINVIHSIEINILKLKSLRKNYEDKNKNL